MEKDLFNEVESFLSKVLSLPQIETEIPGDAIAQIEHYMKHNEYEMAFEGLFIEFIRADLNTTMDWDRVLELGEFLNLDKESIFEPKFWEKLNDFIKSRDKEPVG
jgi:hypothetical protein